MSAINRDTVIREIPLDNKGKPQYKSLIGVRNERIEVIGFNGRFNGITYWVCKCDCGNITTVASSNIRNGTVRSCGCLNHKRINLKGKKVGYLTILEPIPGRRAGNTYWRCRCVCGKELSVQTIYLTTNMKKEVCNISCGCMNPGTLKATERWITHGLSKHSLYDIYRGMIRRCYNILAPEYEHYGGRGIIICIEWYDPDLYGDEKREEGNTPFLNFFRWVYANGYYDQPEDTPRSKRLSIDRIDVNGNYEPSNCRWVPLKEQAWNKQTTRKFYDGVETMNFKQFCKKYNMDPKRTRNRLTYWSIEALIMDALFPEREIHTNPNRVSPYKYIDIDGFGVLIPSVDTLVKLGRVKKI